jgi:cobalt-zinc-cadmium efflux system membrane fusion protein
MKAGLALTLALAACGAAFGQPATVLKMTPQQQERLGVSLEPVREVDSIAVVDLVGRAVRAPSGVRPVIAPFPGTVTKIHVLPGATVKAGDPIATIVSREFSMTASGLSQARADLAAADAAFERQKRLVALGLAPKSSVEEAQARAERARAQVREGSAAAGAAATESHPDAYMVRAPASGRLANILVHAGDPVDGVAPLTSIATSGLLWVEFQVPARLIGEISAGDGVTFANGVTTTIASVSDVVDLNTHSATAVAGAPETLSVFEGQILKARLSRRAAATKFVQAPSRAIVQIDGEDHVFRRTPDGFSPTPVQVVGRTAEAATISGGLRPGDLVAASALSELKSLAMQGND